MPTKGLLICSLQPVSLCGSVQAEYATAVAPEDAQAHNPSAAESESKADREAAESAQKLISSMLRANLTAEATSARLFAGQSSLRPRAEDAKYFKASAKDCENHLESIFDLSAKHPFRHSSLLEALRLSTLACKKCRRRERRFGSR